MEISLRVLDKNTLREICQYPVLVDSGSGLSLIQWVACERAGYTSDMIKKCRHEEMTGFGGKINIMGIIVMPFMLGNTRFYQAMHIIPDDSNLPLVVLGVDWLHHHKVTMNFEKSTLNIYGVSVQMGKPRCKCTAFGLVSDRKMASFDQSKIISSPVISASAFSSLQINWTLRYHPLTCMTMVPQVYVQNPMSIWYASI